MAYTPFCDNNREMEGFRFWKQGFWKDHLRGRPYHISALYVVDLVRFRCAPLAAVTESAGLQDRPPCLRSTCLSPMLSPIEPATPGAVEEESPCMSNVIVQ